VHDIEGVMIEHIRVLETMSPQDFLAFRHNLAPASGFQSVQFREIEFISGLKDERYLDRLELDHDETKRLQRRLDEPTLWDAFCALLEARGLPMPAGDLGGRRDSLLRVARDRELRSEGMSLREIAEVLDAEGLRPKRGGRWHPYGVSRLLDEEVPT
jgi:tryptophan 2,3-dioxygenase